MCQAATNTLKVTHAARSAARVARGSQTHSATEQVGESIHAAKNGVENAGLHIARLWPHSAAGAAQHQQITQQPLPSCEGASCSDSESVSLRHHKADLSQVMASKGCHGGRALLAGHCTLTLRLGGPSRRMWVHHAHGGHLTHLGTNSRTDCRSFPEKSCHDTVLRAMEASDGPLLRMDLCRGSRGDMGESSDPTLLGASSISLFVVPFALCDCAAGAFSTKATVGTGGPLSTSSCKGIGSC